MSIGFLCGVHGPHRQRVTTLPKWRSHEYVRREEPTREERLRQRIEVWREVDPDCARALESLLSKVRGT